MKGRTEPFAKGFTKVLAVFLILALGLPQAAFAAGSLPDGAGVAPEMEVSDKPMPADRAALPKEKGKKGNAAEEEAVSSETVPSAVSAEPVEEVVSDTDPVEEPVATAEPATGIEEYYDRKMTEKPVDVLSGYLKKYLEEEEGVVAVLEGNASDAAGSASPDSPKMSPSERDGRDGKIPSENPERAPLTDEEQQEDLDYAAHTRNHIGYPLSRAIKNDTVMVVRMKDSAG